MVGRSNEKDYLEYERKVRFRLLLSFLLGLLVILGIVQLVFRLSDREIQRIIEEQKEARLALELEKPRLRGFSPEGELVWNISAEGLSVDEEKHIVTFNSTTAEFFDKGELAMTIRVGTLVYDQNSRNMEMYGNIDLKTAEGITVETSKIRWLDSYRKFIFEEGAKIITKEGNVISANYIQSNRTLDQMEGVGNVRVFIKEFKEEELIRKHELTEEKVQLEEFKNITITAEKAIYDRQREIVVGSSRLYEKPFRITTPDGKEVDVAKYQKKPTPVFFKKKELEVYANHVEAHIKDKWVTAVGNVRGKILPSKPGPREDPALKVMRKMTTYFQTEEVEYFWGEDYVRTLSPATVAQRGRFAKGGRLTYYGNYVEPGKQEKQKALFIEGGASLWQKSGEWMFKENLLEGIKEEELQKVMKAEVKLSAEKIVVFLNRNDLHAVGFVTAKQKDREARAHEIIYYDSDKRFVANGDAFYRDKDGQEFFGDQIIYYTEKEDIEVNGSSAATVKIPEKYRKDLDKAISRIKGEKAEESSEKAQEQRKLESKEAVEVKK